jgi:nitrate reductase NapE component
MDDDPNSSNQKKTSPGLSTAKLICNQKWEGYLAILLASLVNFASISDIAFDNVSKLSEIDAVFGVVSFLICFLVLLFDRVKYLQHKIDFKNLYDGKLEGYLLLFFTLWWIVGVGVMTRAGGIAYRVLNTYGSAWFALGQSILTLDHWSKDKDIISIQELTGLSQTLKYWYVLLIVSLVEMGSAVDVLVAVTKNEQDYNSTGKVEYAVAVGAISVPISLMAIMIHYQLVCSKVKPGETTEICVALALCVWWIVAVSLLTADKAIGSTLQGSCGDGAELLGNNLYLSLWIGLYSAVKICLKWKAQRAMGAMGDVIKSRGLELEDDTEEEQLPVSVAVCESDS